MHVFWIIPPPLLWLCSVEEQQISQWGGGYEFLQRYVEINGNTSILGSRPQLAIKHDTISEGGHLWAPLDSSESDSESESESDSESDLPLCPFPHSVFSRPPVVPSLGSRDPRGIFWGIFCTTGGLKTPGSGYFTVTASINRVFVQKLLNTKGFLHLVSI